VPRNWPGRCRVVVLPLAAAPSTPAVRQHTRLQPTAGDRPLPSTHASPPLPRATPSRYSLADPAPQPSLAQASSPLSSRSAASAPRTPPRAPTASPGWPHATFSPPPQTCFIVTARPDYRVPSPAVTHLLPMMTSPRPTRPALTDSSRHWRGCSLVTGPARVG
jgi:hypothetical protein